MDYDCLTQRDISLSLPASVFCAIFQVNLG